MIFHSVHLLYVRIFHVKTHSSMRLCLFCFSVFSNNASIMTCLFLYGFRDAVADCRLADNRCLTIGRYRLIQKKLILLFYLSYLFRLRLLSDDSYLLEGLQSADKKNVPKSEVTKRTHLCRNVSHSHVYFL